MAIEIIPEEKIKKTHWINIALYSCLAIFLVLVISYFILVFYQKKLNQELSELEKALVRTEDEKALEDKVLTYQRKIKDFGILLGARQLPLNVFGFLEKIIHPRVWLSEFNLDVKNNTLSLDGQAENTEIMGQQFMIFEKQEMITDVKLSDLSKDKEGRIDFSLQLTFDPKILK